MMTLKHGKFYDGDVKVPIEHGNKDQILLLEKVNALMTTGCLLRGFDDEDLDGEIQTVTYKYMCVCGHMTIKTYSYEENNELETDKFTCDCKLKYKIEACEFLEFFTVIKLIK